MYLLVTLICCSKSPGKKFYQRYSSKGSLFGNDGLGPQNKGVSRDQPPMVSAASKMTYQQQLQNYKARARDRDERWAHEVM